MSILCTTYQGSPWVWKTPVEEEKEASDGKEEGS